MFLFISDDYLYFFFIIISSSNRQWFKRILSTLGYVSFHLFKTTALVWKISNGYREHCNDKPNQLAPLSSPSRKKGERKRGKNASRPAIIADNIDAPVTNKRPPISTGPHQINIKQKMCNSKRARLSPPLWKPRASELVMWDVKQKLSPSWRPSLPEPPGGGIPN